MSGVFLIDLATVLYRWQHGSMLFLLCIVWVLSSFAYGIVSIVKFTAPLNLFLLSVANLMAR